MRVKETIACGHSFTFTPKLLKNGKRLASFDRHGRMRGVPELHYDKGAQKLALDATGLSEGASYPIVVEITKGKDSNEDFEAITSL